jgi:hypothetical protein
MRFGAFHSAMQLRTVGKYELLDADAVPVPGARGFATH